MTADRICTRVASVIFMIAGVATVLVMRMSDSKHVGICCKCAQSVLLRVAVLLVAALPAGLWALEDHVEMPVHPLSWFSQFVGTMSLLHALYDCIHDVLMRRIDDELRGKSDAVMLAEERGGSARCWGLVWSSLSVTAAAAALFGVVALQQECEGPVASPVLARAMGAAAVPLRAALRRAG
eukprot:Polyplicarium_translucidae@DN2461_c0_g1_i1.p2